MRGPDPDTYSESGSTTLASCLHFFMLIFGPVMFRIFKLVRHFAGLQSLIYTLKQAYKELGLLFLLVAVAILTVRLLKSPLPQYLHLLNCEQAVFKRCYLVCVQFWKKDPSHCSPLFIIAHFPPVYSCFKFFAWFLLFHQGS